MKAKNLYSFNSSPAPDEWKQIPEIKAAKPKIWNREISLQKIDGMNICHWMAGWGGVWESASDLFYIKK